MKKENDDISKILADFEQKKNAKESSDSKAPSEQIDFAKTQKDIKKEKAKEKKDKLKKNFAVTISKLKAKVKSVDFKKLFTKKVIICLCGVLALVIAVCAISIGINQSKGAYLKPYIQKYPDVSFPNGILKEYCDIYGENPDVKGYIKIANPDFYTAVNGKEDSKLAYLEKSTKGSETFNTVVYTNDDTLEKYFKDADAFNKTDGIITYSDLFETYTYKIAGVFYTNTFASDDNGYIFPYNVTEVMTNDSHITFADCLNNRFIYKTLTVTRQDKLLTISCPTEYKQNFRFVIVAVLREKGAEKSEAINNSKIHYPQAVYTQNDEKNPFKYASKWYPEIIVTDQNGNQSTLQQDIKDYEK